MSLILTTLMSICFVAGKSGGHLIPCTTKAEQLLEQNQTVCLFSSGSELDEQILSKHPKIKHLCPITLDDVPEKWWNYPKFLCKIGYYFFSCLYHLYQIKPVKVISFGGLVSVPVCSAAQCLKIPVELHELNVEPGKAINFIARFNPEVHVYFSETARYFPKHRVVFAEYPIRFTEQDKILDRKQLYEKFTLDPNKKTILVLGGSQGSISLNKLIKEFVIQNPEIKNSLQIIHQTGIQDPENYATFYKKYGIDSFVCSFYSELEDFYNLADLLISRAGSGTIFEARFFKVPTIIIPHETTYTRHQILNAESMMHTYPEQFFMIREQNCSAQVLSQAIKKGLSIEKGPQKTL